MRLPILFTALFFVALGSCDSIKLQRYTPETFPNERVHFGSKLGQSASPSEYVLLPNGQLYRNERDSMRYVELPSVSYREARSVFKYLEQTRFYRYDFYFPGEVYYYIREQRGELDHRVLWGAIEPPVREDVSLLYARLEGLVRTSIGKAP